jgi:hypothetical protein
MKKHPVISNHILLLVAPILFLSVQQSKAQSTSCDSLFAGINVPVLEKLAWLAGASVAFAGFDYVGFNLVRNTKTPRLIYRAIQLGVQAGLTWLLYKKFGLPTAIGFNIFWWTFGDDIIFYGITELCNVGGEWRGRGIYKNDISSNHTTWAYWTPVGILRGMDQTKPIAGNTLVAQSLVGACLAVAITISF